MKQPMKKVYIIVSLCSIQFYLAMQTVGQTEATFSSQASSEQVVSAAIVFPKTIQQLATAAKDHSTRANQLYESIMEATLSGSEPELSKLLTNVLNEEHELYGELQSLHTIQDQMDTYHNQIHELPETEQSSYEFERKGYQALNKLILQVNETINLQKIESIKSTIQTELNESKEKINNDIIEPKNDTESNKSHNSEKDSTLKHDSNNSDTDSTLKHDSNDSDTVSTLKLDSDKDPTLKHDSNNSDTDPTLKHDSNNSDTVSNQN
ncbi:hypothetical protein BED47_19275 [Gottfriedia luciferensis]|uniref:DUF4047 domain-containing protein n=1 Tax=Gottfriedia luciferensis TaxID=178774 RepID=A0ABX2ZT96_9BACI|nr:DUF4047 domain-containing protein [Gottfriedia luciferensis]ODG92584.1 hypothetical protein BED47_19275 [Gottfriedia luciferensis]